MKIRVGHHLAFTSVQRTQIKWRVFSFMKQCSYTATRGVCIAVRQLNLTPKPAFKAMTSVLKGLEWTQRITHLSLKWHKSQLPFKSVFVLYLGGLSPLQQGWERVSFTTVRFGWGHPHHWPQALIQTLIIHCLNVHQERTILSPCHA